MIKDNLNYKIYTKYDLSTLVFQLTFNYLKWHLSNSIIIKFCTLTVKHKYKKYARMQRSQHHGTALKVSIQSSHEVWGQLLFGTCRHMHPPYHIHIGVVPVKNCAWPVLRYVCRSTPATLVIFTFIIRVNKLHIEAWHQTSHCVVLSSQLRFSVSSTQKMDFVWRSRHGLTTYHTICYLFLVKL